MNTQKRLSVKAFACVLLALNCWAAQAWAQVNVAVNGNAQKSASTDEAPTSQFGVGQPMGDAYTPFAPVSNELSRLVVYRIPNAKQQSVITLYINGDYHTSLMQAGFTKICLAEPNIHLRTRLRPVNLPVNVDDDKNITLVVGKGQTQYVRVSEVTDGVAQTEVVSAKVAGQEIRKTREQMHALSRVQGASPCEDNPTTHLLHGLVLVAYIEFEAGRSRLTDITPAGLHELDRLLKKLKAQSQDQAQTNLQLVGYAKDGDKNISNNQLAQNRIKTVEEYILSQGIKPKTLRSDARTEKNALLHASKSSRVVVVSATFDQP